MLNNTMAKNKLLYFVVLNSFKFNSKPARNIIYKSPIVPRRIILLSNAIRFKPFGPIIIPDIIIPTMPGILNLFRIIGENNIINNTIANITTGLEKGKCTSGINCISKTKLVNDYANYKNIIK
jgi:hypothetical protein